MIRVYRARYNYLDVNFLEDLLDIIEDVNELDQTETLLKD
ncbi:MAG: hypothetical protein CM15mV82_310 [uncultured marine virus]|nr:MAG: hypothetical protein CM15mV82_310 [uncultured marine virus]